MTRRVISPAGIELTLRDEDGRPWPVLVWAPGPGWRMVASSVTGGGIGERSWWFNTQVNREYFEPDPQAHIARIAAAFGLTGPGVGMLTAADVNLAAAASDGGVHAVATVGLGLPVWAAAPAEREEALAAVPPPGTINVLVVVPVPLADAALVNAVVTLTEAKTQALIGAGVDGSGTSSDAVCVACPVPDPDGEPPQPYAGPRSEWGSRIARAVHTAVSAGTLDWQRRFASRS